MSPSERREMICKENIDLSLTRQCKLLKISRSSIYLDLSRFSAAPVTHLSGYPFKSQRAFPSQG